MKLCPHVQLRTKDGVVQYKGIAIPVYGWDPDTQMDVPLLKCSECGASHRLNGPPVKRVSTRKARY